MTVEGVHPAHRCHQFKRQLVWGDWEERDALRERTARSVPLCRECGAERPKRTPRKRVRVQVEVAIPERGRLLPAGGKTVAERCLRGFEKRERIPAGGYFNRLADSGIAGSVVDEVLDGLMRLGLVRLNYKLRGTRRVLDSIESRDPAGLESLIRPGRRVALARIAREALGRVESLRHPIAAEIARILEEHEKERLTSPQIEVLAAVAEHAETGETLSRPVFSTRYLGDSKVLRRVHGRIRGLIGPLSMLGIREGEALTLLGGAGVIATCDEDLVVGRFPPFIGLTRETLARLERVNPPDDRLLIVENLAVFEACCRHEVSGLGGRLVVWSAGYPGRGVRSLVEAALRGGAGIDIWADLDLDGIRIARLVAQWAPEVRPVRMSPEDFASAPVKRFTKPRARRAIEADLAARPEALLSETLRAIHRTGQWVEQEIFLANTVP